MARELNCGSCGKVMILITDGKIRKGVTVYCAPCLNKSAPKPSSSVDAPDFFKGIFGNRV